MPSPRPSLAPVTTARRPVRSGTVMSKSLRGSQTLLDPDQSHLLLVYTATPGTESHDRLRLLSVIGAQSMG